MTWGSRSNRLEAALGKRQADRGAILPDAHGRPAARKSDDIPGMVGRDRRRGVRAFLPDVAAAIAAAIRAEAGGGVRAATLAGESAISAAPCAVRGAGCGRRDRAYTRC